MSVSPARRAAYAALIRVETGGAFADDALYSGPFERLDVRDRALATEIVLGVLRWRGTLDELIAGPARKPLEELDPEVRTALRIGAYQALRLERVPVRAAVSESVELVKNGPKRSAAGFVNAVLRRLPEWPDETEALERSHPAWLLERWRRRYGSERTRALIEANQRSPETFLRLSRRFDRAETLVKLAVEGVEVDGTEFEGAYRLVAGRRGLLARGTGADTGPELAGGRRDARPRRRALFPGRLCSPRRQDAASGRVVAIGRPSGGLRPQRAPPDAGAPARPNPSCVCRR
jgi:transcription termination factor NusB